MAEIEALKEDKKRLEEERSAFHEPRPGVNTRETVSHEPSAKSEPGVVVLEAEEEETAPLEEIEEIEQELEKIEPEVADIGRGISQSELEDISKELEALESEMNTKVDFAALTRMAEDYKKSLERIGDSITGVDRKVDGVINEMEESGRRFGTYQNIIREISKLDDKTTEILEEIGFGESLNVAKIPPNILESVYESTMEDIINEIRSNYGSQDAENIITKTLEDVRTRTSGSELFYFDGRMLKTRNLAKVIQERLISAKQVQTTYDELLRKLLEYLPGYKAKNFRAMIKLKSQEYAVDKTTYLLDRNDILKREIDELRNMVASVSNRQNSLEIGLNNLMGSKVEKSDLEATNNILEEMKTKQNDLDAMQQKLMEMMEDNKKAISEALEGISGEIKDQETGLPDELMDIPEISEKKEKKKEEKKKLIEKEVDGLKENESKVLRIIPSNGFTLNRIKKELCSEMEDEKIDGCIESLVNKGFMSTVKRGRHTIYLKKVEEKENNGGEK
jgi:DNA repair exonuclease SbcCD ATPase subunit